MLILAGTDINIRDMSVLSFCVNLIKLDLSSNKISKFPPGLSFEHLVNLKLLYLHDNAINEIETILRLFVLKNLTYLALF